MVETDNKQINKRINGYAEPLKEIFAVKLATLEACEKGFGIDKYLKIRNQAILGKAGKAKSERPKITVDTSRGSLTNILKRWRNETAEEAGLEFYRVITLKSIAEIAEKFPVSMVELKAIDGIGRAKLKAYGEDIIELVVDYISREKIDKSVPADALEIPSRPPRKPKEAKGASILRTLELFREGKSVAEIAALRGFVETTIESHLARLISDNSLNAADILPKYKLELITEYFTETEDYKLGPAKEVLGDEVSFSELRYVLNELKREGVVEVGYGEAN